MLQIPFELLLDELMYIIEDGQGAANKTKQHGIAEKETIAI